MRLNATTAPLIPDSNTTALTPTKFPNEEPHPLGRAGTTE
jgi:hypothetical protein